MFLVVFFSLIFSFLSLALIVVGLWEHDVLQVKLGLLAFFGWVTAFIMSIVIVNKGVK